LRRTYTDAVATEKSKNKGTYKGSTLTDEKFGMCGCTMTISQLESSIGSMYLDRRVCNLPQWQEQERRHSPTLKAVPLKTDPAMQRRRAASFEELVRKNGIIR
jgi:hypothetical protein